jgi:hypothetical protein
MGGKRLAGDETAETVGEEVAETTVRRRVCCGFRRTGKAMCQMEDMSRNKYFYPGSYVTCFMFYINL